MNRKEKPADVKERFATREPNGEVLSGEALLEETIKYMEELTKKITPEEEVAFRKELSKLRSVKRGK